MYGVMEGESLSILIVDDLKSARRVLRRLLGMLGFDDVYEAESTESAIEMAAQKQFDIVVSDLNLGDGSGIDLFRQLRAKPEYKNIPFILATSTPEQEIFAMAGDTNLPGVLFKPFSAEELMEKIEGCLE